MIKKLNYLRKRIDKEQGFTLIELLVVIMIIGVLAAIALPIFLNQQKAAQTAALKSDMKNISVAVMTYVSSKGNIKNIPVIDPVYNYIYKINNSDVNGWPSAARVTAGTVIADNFKVSEGTRIGVKLSNDKESYCVIGLNIGSDYSGDITSVTLPHNDALYYDSITGKITERSKITSAGACVYFA